MSVSFLAIVSLKSYSVPVLATPKEFVVFRAKDG